MQTIGILGGMGPAATADFYQRMISVCQKKYEAVQDSDFPPSIIFSIPIKEFDETGIVDDEKVISTIIRGIKTLERGGVDFIAIDCNSVHCFIEKFRRATKLPVVSIVEEVLKIAKSRGYKSVGLLGSQTTAMRGFYENVFSKEKIKIILPTEREQLEVNTVILRVMSGKNNEKDIKLIEKIIVSLCKKDAEAIVLGCTELSVATRNSNFKIPILDSNEILAEAVVARARGRI
ncbi:MAG TPA: amino acid racemase [archaeon]|nr:amino acid racemase [archaeon]